MLLYASRNDDYNPKGIAKLLKNIEYKLIVMTCIIPEIITQT